MQSQLNKYVVQLDARIETKGSKSTKSFLKLFNLAPFLEGSVKLTFYEFVAAKVNSRAQLFDARELKI